MTGLLYKDFVAVKGKIYAAVCLAVTAAAVLSVMLIPSDEVSDNFIWYGIMCVIALGYFALVGKLEISLMEVDEGRRRKNYILSLPVSKNKYIASKYILLLSAFYILMFIGILLSAVLKVGRGSADIIHKSDVMLSIMPIIVSVILVIPSIEMPFFAALGGKKGMRIKTGIMIGLFFLVVAYMLFGDLTIFNKISIERLVKYLISHKNVLRKLQIPAICISAGLYYLSYRVSCMLFARKEWSDD